MKPFDSPGSWDRMDSYDTTPWAITDDQEEASSFLAKLADGGPALELGIGTGRVALALARAGVEVTGIESSPGMVQQLRAKPGGQELEVIVGDFSEVPIDREFSLVYCVFNTFFLLLTQGDQIRCFQNVAAKLRPGGAFVLQTFVPSAQYFSSEQWTETVHVAEDETVLLASVHDATLQRVNRQQIVLNPAGARFLPMSYRYSWPTELDLMARISGLTKEGRWSGWNGEPFRHPGRYVTVYRKSA